MARPPLWPMNFRVNRNIADLCNGTSDVTQTNFPDELRAFMAWWTRQPGAKMPARPTEAQLVEGAARAVEIARKREQGAGIRAA